MLFGQQLIFIEPALFLFTLTAYYNTPTEQQLIFNKVCLKHFNETYCPTTNNFGNETDIENKVHEEATKLSMYGTVIKCIATLAATFQFGSLSDHMGRKKVILFATVGDTISAIIYFFNAWYISASVSYIYLGDLISGCCGSFTVMIMSSLAYVGDTTTANARTTRLLIIEMLMYLASIISFFTGGMIIQKLGFCYVYGLNLICYVFILIYVLCLKESYHPPVEVSIKSIICQRKFGDYYEVFRQNKTRNFGLKVGLLLSSFIAIFMATSGIDSTLILYLFHTPLNFDATSVGYVLASENSVKVVGGLIVSFLLIKSLKWRDSSIIVLSTIFLTGYSVSLAFSRQKLHVFLSTIWGLGICGGVSACRSGFSKLVPSDQLGKINSILSISQELCLLFAGIIFKNIYQYTVHITPSLTLFVIGGFSVLAVIFATVLKVYDREIEYENIDESNDESNN